MTDDPLPLHFQIWNRLVDRIKQDDPKSAQMLLLLSLAPRGDEATFPVTVRTRKLPTYWDQGEVTVAMADPSGGDVLVAYSFKRKKFATLPVAKVQPLV